jgi:lysyl-tRNA synthetase class 1
VLELELDRVAESIHLKQKENEKEEQQNKKLYFFSLIAGRKIEFIPVDYGLVASLVQLFKEDDEVVFKLIEMGHLKKKEKPEVMKQLKERIKMARKWVEKHAPKEFKLKFLEKSEVQPSRISEKAKRVFSELIKKISKAKNAEQIQEAVFSTAKENGLPSRELFQALYLSLIGKERGPKLGSLVFALGKERVIQRLKELSS